MTKISAFHIRQLVYVAIVLSFVLMIIYPLLAVEGSGLEIHCLFKRLTGIPCPTCGMSRSFYLFWQGDFPKSIHYNLITIPFYLFYGYLAFSALKALFLKREFAISTFFAWIIVVALLLSWIWKFMAGVQYY